ncbi:N-acetylglutamate kinase [bacterium A37T11]|nr:N-acetylglutamate kinase [bacterium A37T11]
MLYIIKIGGNIIDSPAALGRFVADFSLLPGDKILVHGGGKIATQVASDLGIAAKLVDGRRITDEAMLRVVTMVYAGLASKDIVARLQALGVDAIGLSGADANSIRTVKRPVKDIDYGFVGDIEEDSVNVQAIETLLKAGFTPVFSAITHDGNGQLLNTNADTIASALSIALSKSYETSLVYCFEKKGVLRDVNDENSVVREIREDDVDQLIEKGIVAGGMIPKLHNAFQAINSGVKDVYIGHADELELLKTQSFGTRMLK